MHLLRNLKIRHQFLILFWVMLLGFSALGFLYRQVLHVEKSAADRFQQVSSFINLLTKISADMAEMKATDQAFLQMGDLRYAEVFESLIGQVYEELDQLEQFLIAEQQMPEEKIRHLVAQVRETTRNYENAFDLMTNLQVQLGTDENQGLQGELRTVIHRMEDRLQSLGNLKLLVSLLQMRRHEKDFILRKHSKYLNQMAEEQKNFQQLLEKSEFSEEEKAAIAQALQRYRKLFKRFTTVVQEQSRQSSALRQTWHAMNQQLNILLLQEEDAILETMQLLEEEQKAITKFFIATLFTVSLLTATLLVLLILRMRRSLTRLQDTVQKVSEGDLSARTRLDTQDELGMLGAAFDKLLDERMATLAAVEKENEQLNESIIALMMAVSQLSQKDLTVRVPVAEDVTGPVSDAVNLMASETAQVLAKIRQLSTQVEEAAVQVRTQAERVTEVANQERALVQENAEHLQKTGEAMTGLARSAQRANKTADLAMSHTQNAQKAVSTTVEGIGQIREIIRETEKRIKRLGERSQEITGAVNLINTIAERTHILALNASMHAASAGEAGRGFAVVAEEVQRLAGSSREATADIARMVNAIRVETADTVDTMNRLIAQVAEGTRLAQGAGERMQETETTTAELVAAVAKIAEAAEQQARDAEALIQRSQTILEITEQADQALREQSEQTVRLVNYSEVLLDSVKVFKLPETTD